MTKEIKKTICQELEKALSDCYRDLTRTDECLSLLAANKKYEKILERQKACQNALAWIESVIIK